MNEKPIIGVISKPNIFCDEQLFTQQIIYDGVRNAILTHGGLAVGILPTKITNKFCTSDEIINDSNFSLLELQDLYSLIDKCNGIIIQGGLLLLFLGIGILIRYIITDGNLLLGLGSEMTGFIDNLSLNGVMETLSLMLPILIAMILLTFFAYSLLAGILASMTTNLEDFQQLQTPIVIISLVGYYLSMMASMFSGSVFIKIMSYVPFISSMLAPTLYVMGEIGLVDLIISIVLLVGMIGILIKYGLRIYKVGILNYSQTGLWKKMFKAMKEG